VSAQEGLLDKVRRAEPDLESVVEFHLTDLQAQEGTVTVQGPDGVHGRPLS
jgi:hypothetical protein